ncbi:MAG: hypothetical protein IT537_07085 [Hyphomicrobiales bacterium]|nr:hypothetical protein [Hyphomicrobiales bacterium]
MRSAHLHPEFGYLCPSPGLRRFIAAVLLFAVVGVVALGNSLGSLIADHDAGKVGAVLAASAEVLEPIIAAGEPAKDRKVWVPLPIPRPGSAPEPRNVADVPTEPEAAEAPVVPAAATPPAAAAQAGTSCGTWAHLEGRCRTGRMRSVRVALADPLKVVNDRGAAASASRGRSAKSVTGAQRTAGDPVAAPLQHAAQQPTLVLKKAKQSKRTLAADSHGAASGRLPSREGVANGAAPFNRGPFAGLFGVSR